MRRWKAIWRKARKNKKGFTLVEVLVSFAMLAIFVTAAAQCLVPVANTYYKSRMLSEAQTISQTVLEEMEQQLGVLRGNVNANDGTVAGYLTLYDAAGTKVAADASGMSGTTIEYISGTRATAGYVAQMDTKGFDGYVVNAQKKQFLGQFTDEAGIATGYLVKRFYEEDEETPGAYISQLTPAAEDGYVSMDKGVTVPAGMTVAVARAVENSFGEGFYNDFEISELTFDIPQEAIKPNAEHPEQSDVYYVNVSFQLINDRYASFSYHAKKSVYLQNSVAYQ